MGQKLSAANAPDKAVDAVVNQMKGTDWSSFKSMIYQVYAKEKDAEARAWADLCQMILASNAFLYVE